MKCPFCNNKSSKVVDSRDYSGGYKIKRRRECLSCKRRFTTYETVEHIPIYVIKRDSTREEFSKEKLMKGLLHAVVKRDISRESLETLVSDIEKEIYNSSQTEIKTEDLGELIMDELKKIDEVAYVRFASVYKQFDDVKSFVKEIEGMKK